MRPPIIEDELKAAARLEKGLRQNGFAVDVAHDGEDGRHGAGATAWHADPLSLRRACLTLLGLLLLGGCASYRPQPLSPPDSAAAFAARSFGDPGLQAYLARAAVPVAPGAPWDFPRLLLAATYYHPALKLAAAQWQTAQARVLAAGARPNPTATASTQYNQDAPDGVSPWSNGLALDFTLETAGRRADRVAQALHAAEAARWRFQGATWQVHSRLRRRLLALYQAQQRAAILRRLEAAQERYVALLEQRGRSGDASSFELAQMRLALDDTRLRRRTEERRAAVGRARVADAIGVPAAALANVPLALALFDHAPLAADTVGPRLRAQALTRRADMLAALADYAAAEAALKLEIARQYPDLRLGPGYLWDEGQRKWSLALGFALPFNRNRGPIAVARARREEAATRFLALQDRVAGEIDATGADYAGALAQLDTADRLLAAAAAQRRLLSRRLRPGAVSSLAALDAEIVVTRAGQARLDALVSAQEALGRLEDAVRQPLDPLESPPAGAGHGP